MPATLLGSLLVSLGLDSAEFDKGVGDAKKQIKTLPLAFTASSKEIAASADKMGVSFGQFTAKVRALQTTLDPAGAALKAYRNEVRLLQEAYKLGAVSQDQFKTGIQSAVASYRQSSAVVASANRGAKFGLQDLGFQLQDVAVQYAGGTKAAVIFAQQGPQIVQAVQMMSNGTGKFATFMGGPWGVAIGVGVAVLGTLAVKLFETDDAAAKAAKSQRTFAEVLKDSKSSYQELIKAAQDYAREQAKADETTLHSIQTEAAATAAKLKSAAAERQKLQAALENYNFVVSHGGFGNSDVAGGAGMAAAQVSAEMAKNQRLINDLAKDAAAETNKVADAVSDMQSDPVKDIKAGFEELQRQAKLTIRDVKELTSRLADLKKQEDAQVKAAQQAARDETRMIGQETKTFTMPVRGGSISGNYNEPRPGHNHAGIDIAVPVGTAVRAPAGGTIIEAGTLPGYGNVVFIDHGGGTISRLAHLSRINVKYGQTIDQGDVIGASGGARGAVGAGNSRGPHLHYEVRVGGRSVDPRRGSFIVDPLAAAEKSQKLQEQAQRKAEAAAAKAEREREAAVRHAREFADQTAAVESDLLRFKRDHATSAEEIAQFAHDELKVANDKYIADVQAKVSLGDLTEAQGKELILKHAILSALEDQEVERQKQIKLSQQATELSATETENQVHALQTQADLADSQTERKKIALQILDAEYRQQKAALTSAILDEENLAKKQDLQTKLAGLEANHAGDIAAASRQNETPRERFMRDLNPSASALSEQIDQIEIDGLNSLNDQLADAIIHFKSLGDVAKNVLQGIATDLLRLQIRKAVIEPLAKALGLGGSSIGKIGGNTKGLESNFDKILGGSGGSAGLTAAGSTLTTAGTSLNAAAAQLQIAATRLATSSVGAVTGGGGGLLKGLLGVAGAVAGSINFGGLANAGASAVGKSVVGGAHAALKMFAGGTNFAPGGISLVGERGPELVNLPRGSQVIPNHELRGLAKNDNMPPLAIHFHGNVDERQARQSGRQAASSYNSEMAKARRNGIVG